MSWRSSRCAAVIALIWGMSGVGWAEQPGEKVFRAHCDACHARGQVGATALSRTIGWNDALLEDRKGLIADYIRYVVRNGRNNMPPLTRVELTDDELREIVEFLTRKRDAS